MIVETVSGRTERDTLIAMITSNEVLSDIAPRWQDNLMPSKLGNTVASLCVGYHTRYNKAPRKAIQTLFSSWSQRNGDKDTIRLVDAFLSSLSGEYESLATEVNYKHALDVAGELFNRTKVSRLIESLQGELDSGRLDKAEDAITKFSRVELGAGAGVKLFVDNIAVKDTFTKAVRKPLVEYPHALGPFFYNTLERDSFVVFAGKQKVGKTFFLVDLAYRLMLNRKRVAFFEIGDLSETQLKERFLVRASEHPIRSQDGKWPYVVNIPTGISHVKGEENANITTIKKTKFDNPLDYNKAWKTCQDVMKSKVKSKKPYFIQSCHPNLSISILGIKSILETWERSGWVADVVIIDYADNLSPIDSKMENRDQINHTWKLMRALSIEKHCLLVTATQISARGFTKRWLTRGDFSEDNRKLNHVTAMVGINDSEEEKQRGIYRLNWIVKREGEYSSQQGPSIASCLALGSPAVLSIPY